jgi:predicted ArsR family transcriptional regulator
MATAKLDNSQVVEFLSQTRTVTEVAARFAVTKATATKYLQALVTGGQVSVTGVKPTGSRGRPSRLYTTSPAPAPTV